MQISMMVGVGLVEAPDGTQGLWSSGTQERCLP
jgi:hypothetical protein